MSAIKSVRVGGAAAGSAAQRTEHVRPQFDRALWAKMRPGDVMVVPAGVRLPTNLRNYSEVHTGNDTLLSKLPEPGTAAPIIGFDATSLFED